MSGKEQDVELELRVRDGENRSRSKDAESPEVLGCVFDKDKDEKDEQFTGVFRIEVLQEVGFVSLKWLPKQRESKQGCFGGSLSFSKTC